MSATATLSSKLQSSLPEAIRNKLHMLAKGANPANYRDRQVCI